MSTTKNRRWRFGAGLAAAFAVGTAAASGHEPLSPAGLWETFDDASGLLRAVVRIAERDGRYVGVIEEVRRLPGDQDADAVCHRCDDHRKDQPIRGMTILTDLQNSGTDFGEGRILDPANGVVYRCRVRVIDSGRRLEVRGYVGISLFGRTQTWRRRGD